MGNNLFSLQHESATAVNIKIPAEKPEEESLVNPLSIQYQGVKGRREDKKNLENLLLNQKYSFEQVYSKREKFDTPKFHYDWWLFPTNAPKGQWSVTADYYSIDEKDTLTLLTNRKFVERYVKSIEMYLKAQLNQWNQYDVRFGKVLLSLIHFISIIDNRQEHLETNLLLLEALVFAIKLADDVIYPLYCECSPNTVYPYNAIERAKKFLQHPRVCGMIEQLAVVKLQQYCTKVKALIQHNDAHSLRYVSPFLERISAYAPDPITLVDLFAIIATKTQSDKPLNKI